MAKLTHVDKTGQARMVDVGTKEITQRRAVAQGRVLLGKQAYELLKGNKLAKGDALAVARLAGIQAAKRTAEWIPLCHPIPLSHLEVSVELDDEQCAAVVGASASANWTTGVEMEALVAVSAACLALYDMAKAVDRGITVTDLQLMEKSGGRSGTWKRPARRRRSAR